MGPSLTNEEIMNKKYVENMQERNANQKTENITSNINDNEKFCFPRKNFKSPKVKSKMHAKHQKNKGQPNQLYNKNVTHSESQPQDKEVSAHGAIYTQQDTEAERINRQKMELKQSKSTRIISTKCLTTLSTRISWTNITNPSTHSPYFTMHILSPPLRVRPFTTNLFIPSMWCNIRRCVSFPCPRHLKIPLR